MMVQWGWPLLRKWFSIKNKCSCSNPDWIHLPLLGPEPLDGTPVPPQRPGAWPSRSSRPPPSSKPSPSWWGSYRQRVYYNKHLTNFDQNVTLKQTDKRTLQVPSQMFQNYHKNVLLNTTEFIETKIDGIKVVFCLPPLRILCLLTPPCRQSLSGQSCDSVSTNHKRWHMGV